MVCISKACSAWQALTSRLLPACLPPEPLRSYFRGSFVRSSAEDQVAYTPGRERYLPDTDPESSETILGEEQWAWLEEQFSQPATVRVVVASFQLAVVGHGFERWGLLPAELQRFYDLIESTRANGVVILSGDRHIGAIYR